MDDVGTFRKYQTTLPRGRTMELIALAAPIIESYERAGYSMTLRQLYYQLVARGVIPNAQEQYDKLGDAVSTGRMCGLLSWTGIEDRTRNLRGRKFWKDPADAWKDRRNEYHTDRWRDQTYRPEVWIEKEALAGVIEPICYELSVDFFACRGYNSQSEQWRAGQRFANYINKGQQPIIFHLGDHDPSGMDMTRDNRERLAVFAGVSIMVVRLALNMDQIEKYKPPPNPAKLSDARAAKYVDEYGSSSWELDALPPDALTTLIRDAVISFRDPSLWDAALKREAADKDQMDITLEGMEE